MVVGWQIGLPGCDEVAPTPTWPALIAATLILLPISATVIFVGRELSRRSNYKAAIGLGVSVDGWLLIVCTVGIFGLGMYAQVKKPSVTLPFKQSDWSASTDHRTQMARTLIANQTLTGKQRKEVIAILGSDTMADSWSVNPRTEIEYQLTDLYTYLRIELDTTGTVRSVSFNCYD